jgi:hypothetical protein
MSKEYIIIQTHSENNADSLSVERFTSAREAIFYFIDNVLEEDVVQISEC